MNEELVRRASRGLRPAVTMQPTIGGESGAPLGIVIAEVICRETEENDLFAGLGAFTRAELPAAKTATEIALEQLLRELGMKGRKIGADAIVAAKFELLRGVNAAGHKVLRMTAAGTAIALPPGPHRP
jgi:uncharacterized protein YbjQ (UPF0145 family)